MSVSELGRNTSAPENRFTIQLGRKGGAFSWVGFQGYYEHLTVVHLTLTLLILIM